MENLNNLYFLVITQRSTHFRRFVVVNKHSSGNIFHTVIKKCNLYFLVPFFGLRRAVALPPVLEPVADLSCGQAGGFSQLALFPR